MRKTGVWLALVAVLLAATGAAAQATPGVPLAGQDRSIAEMMAACNQMMGQMQQMMGRMNQMMGMMGGGMMGRGMMGGPGSWNGWWLGGAWLLWLILLALAVTVVVLLLRGRPSGDAALAALQIRLAKGEISAEEYEQTRRLLRG
ncbi:MAG: SHOCT domain-containing protein [Armatimonadota bacterium]|nr:SHOCT domain-containing protein [Armatimonadota bacterium]MDR5697557.1 SHOCT domain-containing protein [Armatimonadota bacterium]